ncbi:hypothetical protein KFK09_004971 [Dendrobium nobile]|uniref:Uncharacterized protein n=1 Tax=Dendrobium nobile TaxID=94219 RepID=A0A8T3BX27_DENNO|nr:hypothetical protein KFK09_004971 [Dendrobium nobile]
MFYYLSSNCKFNLFVLMVINNESQPLKELLISSIVGISLSNDLHLEINFNILVLRYNNWKQM